jgi:hypothetical protein
LLKDISMRTTLLVAPALVISTLLASCTVAPIEGGTVIIYRERDRDDTAAQAASALVVADGLARLLQAVADECRALGREDLRIDCLGVGYGRVAASVPRDATFLEARANLARASRELRAVAQANRAPAAPSVAAPSGGGALTAVAPARQSSAETQALAILERTQTVLLRSSATVPDQPEAYGKIAAALDSGKVLLRS